MKRAIAGGFLLCMVAALAAGQEQFPFPHHTIYHPSAIRPSALSQGALDDSTARFYERWKARFLRAGCVPGEYYVWTNEGSVAPDDTTICVSEGQGYGMVITAFMAGADPRAREYFDGLYRWFRSHPTAVSDHLMAWRQINGCVTGPDGDDDSATDGDLDIAYGLLLADRQWGSEGSINYRAEALAVIAAIKEFEVHPAIQSIELGSWAVPGSGYEDGTRTSDFTLNHFRAFFDATGDSVWLKALDRCYAVISAIQTQYSPITGLLPDFARRCDTSPEPAPPHYLESSFDGHYFWNACRTPWRIALDYLLDGDVRAHDALQRINGWIRSQTDGHPWRIRAGYRLNGTPITIDDGPMAFTAPFAVGAMVDAGNREWLDSLWVRIVTTSVEEEEYYGNSLKLLSLIVLSGNWWNPAESGSGTAIELAPGWNALALPCHVPDGRPAVVFPTANSAAYLFAGSAGYRTADTLVPGSGYWVKFPFAHSLMLEGPGLSGDTLLLEPGWNLIGGVSQPAAVQDIMQIPPGIVQSAFFEYRQGYTPSDTLRPSRAYWVRAAQRGGLLPGGTVPPR